MIDIALCADYCGKKACERHPMQYGGMQLQYQDYAYFYDDCADRLAWEKRHKRSEPNNKDSSHSDEDVNRKEGEMETLGEALPKEIERVQDLVALYMEAPFGRIAAALMKADIARAHKAIMEGDLVGMIEAYKTLKEYDE